MREKLKVLFVCIGNSCRSPMAEGFGRHYGSDVMLASSAGLSPASIVQPETVKTLKQRGIDISAIYPKSVYEVPGGPFHIIVNMSGQPLPRQIVPAPGGYTLDWLVHDPIGQSDEIYHNVAEQLSGLVMQLVLKLRASPPSKPSAAPTGQNPPRRSRLWRELGDAGQS
ncbi:MAG: hypothetical protein FJW20_26465 [Acidimicrobiia bacterium]|nr:hypothetical protein [Acidimicrobiia bacterium]